MSDTEQLGDLSYDSEVGALPVKIVRLADEQASLAGALGIQWFEIEGRECLISLEARPFYCDRGNWIAKITPRGELAISLDHHDGWPRYYFDRDRAFEEIAAWLMKRGQWPRSEA